MARCRQRFLALALSACAPCCAPAQEPDRPRLRATVESVGKDAVLRLTDGRRLALQGVSLPAAAVRPKGFAARLRESVERMLRGSDNRVWVSPDRGALPGIDLVGSVWTSADAAESVNEALLRQGLALLSCRTPGVRDLAKLRAAARRAQTGRLGWFAGSAATRFTPDRVPFLNGAVLGLHHQVEWADYHPQLDELATAGFRHVCLLFSVFVDKVDSVAIRRDHVRTVRDVRLIETIRYAKGKGLSIMLLPIVLILKPGDEDWRGVLRPKDEEQFWQNYDRFLAHYLDISERTGVEIFCIGSELGSLEDRTATWQRLIHNARGRFRGLLTYSANWDHAEGVKFFPQLDLVGMTAYFSLTKKLDPSLDELVAEWRRVGKAVDKAQKWHKRPVIFTELGYASQNGINRDPWNYVMAKDEIDLQEQVDCFAAFRRVAPEIEVLGGAYLYDFYDKGGKRDWSYSPRGKPAMDEWRAWAKYRPGK